MRPIPTILAFCTKLKVDNLRGQVGFCLCHIKFNRSYFHRFQIVFLNLETYKYQTFHCGRYWKLENYLVSNVVPHIVRCYVRMFNLLLLIFKEISCFQFLTKQIFSQFIYMLTMIGYIILRSDRMRPC